MIGNLEKFAQSVVTIKDERDVVRVLYEYFSQGFFAVKEL